MKVNKQQRGFTLPEVLVSLAVLTMVIVASTNLVVSIIRTNNDNINTLMAYGLAQEGLEGFRNVRDSNWLLSADFEGMVKWTNIWGVDFPLKAEEKFYVIDLFNLGDASQNIVDSVDQITGNAPWRLEDVDDSELDKESLVKKFFATGDSGFRYGHKAIKSRFENDFDETPFHRYLVVKGLEYDEDNKLTQMRVTSIVYWKDGGRDRRVELTTELTDWNQGQL